MLHNEHKADSSVWIKNIIRDFLQFSENNTLGAEPHERAWAEPLVGFSRGDDPLYEQFKKDIGPFYLTPGEIYNRTFPERPVRPEFLTVISWVLPQTEATKSDARKEFWYPPERWVRSRQYGEDCNVRLHVQVVKALQLGGYRAVAPSRSALWGLQKSERFGESSSWSERHAAYVSGLGTFGLCDGLITAAGKAVRCGSVVACISIPPRKRPYTDFHEYCLFFSKGICGACINRCPAGAITDKGHDKEKCRAYIVNATLPYSFSKFQLAANACGLCQTKVPCESGIP
jgi:epoxyqueuosine reductase